MRKIIMYCDRCKKEFKKWNHKKAEVYGVAEFIYDDCDPYLDSPKDLCESCYTELENWWTEKNKKEAEYTEESKVYKTRYYGTSDDWDDWKDPRL